MLNRLAITVILIYVIICPASLCSLHSLSPPICPSVHPSTRFTQLFTQQVLSQALEGWVMESNRPQRTQAHPCLPTPTTSSLSGGEEKRFSRKNSNSLRVDSHRLPPRWPQPGCVPSRQLLVKVFKQSRRPLVALRAAGHKSCHLEEGPLMEGGYPVLSQEPMCPAPGPEGLRRTGCCEPQKPLAGPEGVEQGCPPPWQEDWLHGPQRHIPC